MKRRSITPVLPLAMVLLLGMTGWQGLYAQMPTTSVRFDRASDYQVVFDITSGEATAQQQVVREAGLIIDAHPDAQVEVVFYGKSLGLVQKAKSSHVDAIQKLIAKGVSFKVCHIAMDHQHVTESQLITGVKTVPDGIYEIISKQKKGWGYIKVTP